MQLLRFRAGIPIEGTRTNPLKRLESLSQSQRTRGSQIVHFSAHGVRDHRGSGSLCPVSNHCSMRMELRFQAPFVRHLLSEASLRLALSQIFKCKPSPAWG